VIGILAVAALWIRPPQVAPVAPFARPEPVAAEPDSDRVTWQHVDTLRSGETLSALFARGGVSGGPLTRLLQESSIDERRAPAGIAITIRSRAQDSTPSEIILKLSVDRLIHLRHLETGWTAIEERLPWHTDTVVVGGAIRSTLYDAMDSAATDMPRAARAELVWALADIYEYRVDMSRDLHPDDAFRVMFERATGPEGVVRIGKILAARFQVNGAVMETVRFPSGDAHEEYFDREGRSMRAAFLRAPVQFRRISSGFGMRLHPILGIWRRHTGTDYAADAGTPVRAVGAGIVTIAGREGGYGRLVQIRHRNGFVTRYGHLRAFAAGIHEGVTVDIGQTIGYVGMSGLATAPHLHFEVLVYGVQRDPHSALAAVRGTPVPDSLRAEFEAARVRLLAELDRERNPLMAVERLGRDRHAL
jgi:murein DD-endopeptidase MepM/ murein hydrolase activator NlpD